MKRTSGISLVGVAGLVVAAALAAPAAHGRPGDIIVGDSSASEVLRVNPRTGASSPISADPMLVAPNDSVIGRDGTIYVADYDAFGGGGGVIAINPRNGNASVVSDDPLFDQPDGIAMAPSGDLFVTDLDGLPLLRVNMPSGATSVVTKSLVLASNSPTGVVVPPAGVPFVMGSFGLARVDPDTGSPTIIADSGDGLTACCGLVRDAGGTLFSADSADGVQSVNPRTRKVRDRSGPVSYDGYGMAYDLEGRILLAADDEINRVNPRSGAVRQVADGFDYAEGMEVEPPRCNGLYPSIVGTNRKDILRGSPFGDVIHGIDGNDTIKGRRGKDVICGGAGRDDINGGPQRDRCKGQSGRDRERNC